MPECNTGERTIMGTPTKDRSCELISECYRECAEDKYASSEHNCYGLRGGNMTCNDCRI